MMHSVPTEHPSNSFEAIVVGGSYAGLSAAMQSLKADVTQPPLAHVTALRPPVSPDQKGLSDSKALQGTSGRTGSHVSASMRSKCRRAVSGPAQR
jgi:hypothetical protein